ncbi:uncharacterized protein RJT20DRAFT_28959 [Scheffersomyces xylosifermentans]|uniref:uncharacterized protein n=1 Tax=Scheffersomyces xylosifermentans TaxID=1304137 RepID=UPI00315C518D
MNKLASSKFLLHKNVLILNKPLINLNIRHQLDDIPDFRKKLLALYKQFYKLRNTIHNGHRLGPVSYHTILRRNFQHIPFNARRIAILLSSDISGETIDILSESELIERMINTLMFVFNSTVRSTTDADIEPAVFFEDIKKTKADTFENSIISTIIRMDGQKPDEIKYDFKYSWVKPFDESIAKYDQHFIDHPQSKKFKSKYPMTYIGFRQYETTLMRLNENLKLCL